MSADRMQALVRIDRVSKRYGEIVALDSLSLEVLRGETLGLLGPNGAGKTTLMHILAGVLSPDSGTVRIGADGDPRSRSTRQAIGLAPQSLALYPQLTARENLRLFGRLFGVRGRELEVRTREALALADLEGRAGDRVATFSGGMQRRLNLACAVLHGPALLLLDEPTAGVDPQSRNRLFGAIDRLKEQGLTVLYSTHRMEEAERLCDRVAIIDFGRVLAVDSLPQLLRRHDCPNLDTLFLSLTGRGVRD